MAYGGHDARAPGMGVTWQTVACGGGGVESHGMGSTVYCGKPWRRVETFSGSPMG